LTKVQILSVFAAIILIVLLFLAPHQTSNNEDDLLVGKEVAKEEPSIARAVELVKGASPMAGIMMLRELLERNPDDIDAHFQLGLFSEMSGQMDKAKMRFQKVVELDSTRSDAVLKLAKVFVGLGEVENAITEFEKYKSSLSDDEKIVEIDNIIEKLKS